MIENYQDLNRDETLDAVADFDGERLAAFVEYEREHKDRKTVIEPLERELVDVVPADGRQYVAGVWFDDASEPERWSATRTTSTRSGTPSTPVSRPGSSSFTRPS
jgi:hypothetical protein